MYKLYEYIGLAYNIAICSVKALASLSFEQATEIIKLLVV